MWILTCSLLIPQARALLLYCHRGWGLGVGGGNFLALTVSALKAKSDGLVSIFSIYEHAK